MSRDSAVDRASNRQRWLLLIVVILVGLASNAWRDLVQPDEGRYAEIPREMLASGEWVVPQLNGLPYVEKPPLQYWATALAYKAFGVSDEASRLWNLLMGIGGVVLVYLTGRRLWNARAGEFAALVLLSTPLYMLVGQLNLLDMGITFFLTAALCAFVLAQRDDADADENRRWMLWCWVSVGLGFLQKGLEAFAIPFLALVAYSCLQRDLAIWKRMHLGKGALIVGLFSLPWLLALGLRDGAYTWFFLVHEHFTRFMTTEHQRNEPWWFFLAVFAVMSLPWSLPMLRAAWDRTLRRDRHRFDPEAALAVWSVVVVLFFSLSGSKLVPYIMPVVPPLALLLGRAIDARPLFRTALPALVSAGLLGLLLLGAGFLVDLLVADGTRKAFYVGVSQWAMGAGACLALAVVLSIRHWRAQRVRAAMITLCVGLYLGWVALMGGSNLMATLRGAPGAGAAMAPRIAAGARFYCVGAYLQSLNFELGQTCRLVEYRGELQLQFDRDGSRQPLSFDAFLAEWQAGGKSVALVHRRYLARFAEAAVPTRTLVEYPEFVILEHP